VNDFDRLSQIQTLWSVVRRAHGEQSQEIQAAQQQLLERYGGAARRYLLAALRNDDEASEVYQEFALRFVRGDFHRADPAKGRFRSFLKTALHHLIVDLHKRRAARPSANENLAALAGPDTSAEREREFSQGWRDELLARTWQALAKDESASGKPLYTVLRFRATWQSRLATGGRRRRCPCWLQPSWIRRRWCGGMPRGPWARSARLKHGQHWEPHWQQSASRWRWRRSLSHWAAFAPGEVESRRARAWCRGRAAGARNRRSH
jgi:DNA-directed RNA polymerase specialized sigma24 family protein